MKRMQWKNSMVMVERWTFTSKRCTASWDIWDGIMNEWNVYRALSVLAIDLGADWRLLGWKMTQETSSENEC